MGRIPLFNNYKWTADKRSQLDRDGHIILPGLLTDEAQSRLTHSLQKVSERPRTSGVGARSTSTYAAEYDTYLESLIADPEMLQLAGDILGQNYRYDHCVTFIRPGGNKGTGWHTHGYAEDDLDLGFIRVFFYVNGFEPTDGGIKAVPGSHLHRRTGIHSSVEDRDMWAAWGDNHSHPGTGEQMQVEELSAPPGTVVVMWTHALHAVTPRKDESVTRWCVVYAYRNPGRPSEARRISFSFEEKCRKQHGNLADLY